MEKTNNYIQDAEYSFDNQFNEIFVNKKIEEYSHDEPIIYEKFL